MTRLMNEPAFDRGQLKRLVLCLDGTWKTADSTDITNIVRIRDLIDPKFKDCGGKLVKQRVYYEEGIGTVGTKAKRVFEGATGGGLEDNVRGAYRFLSGIYEPGLEVYIFGFSRGAFTARSLTGYIGASGLLKPEYCSGENERRAWAFYRTPPKFRFPSAKRALSELSFPDVRIKLLGVFDTVGSRGIPGAGLRNVYNRRQYGFHDVTLSTIVDHALHALAIDERRLSFPASMWQYPNHKDNLSVEQVWFPGNHSNIGGGYPDEALSSIALEWMLSRIEDRALGLRFVDEWRKKLNPDPLGRIYDETEKWKYTLSKWKPSIRTINQWPAKIHGQNVGLPPHAIPIGEMLHWTALHRREDRKAKYEPANLESALAAIENGKQVISVVGRSGRPLRWFECKEDREELFELLSPRLRSIFDRAAAGIKDAEGSIDLQEAAKIEASKEVA
jgi:hypothetical protein